MVKFKSSDSNVKKDQISKNYFKLRKNIIEVSVLEKGILKT